jgi:hypothetical protein
MVTMTLSVVVAVTTANEHVAAAVVVGIVKTMCCVTDQVTTEIDLFQPCCIEGLSDFVCQPRPHSTTMATTAVANVQMTAVVAVGMADTMWCGVAD